MKIVAQMIVWLSLATGVVSAATAYLASLDGPDSQLLGRTLAAPTGRLTHADGSVTPVAEKDEVVSVALLAELRAAGVTTVRVKEFDLKRWRGKWYFLVSLCGLLLGGLTLRAASNWQRSALTDVHRELTPTESLDSIHDEVQTLRERISALPEEQALDLIIKRVSNLQRGKIPAFAESRESLIASLGLGTFASLMDSFAGAERYLNRAWSAAVDGQHEEAIACLYQSSQRLDETLRKMRGGETS
jgi:hypothetical protein